MGEIKIVATIEALEIRDGTVSPSILSEVSDHIASLNRRQVNA